MGCLPRLIWRWPPHTAFRDAVGIDGRKRGHLPVTFATTHGAWALAPAQSPKPKAQSPKPKAQSPKSARAGDRLHPAECRRRGARATVLSPKAAKNRGRPCIPLCHSAQQIGDSRGRLFHAHGRPAPGATAQSNHELRPQARRRKPGATSLQRAVGKSNTRQVVVACANSVPSGPTRRASAVASWRPAWMTLPMARTRCTLGLMARTMFTPSSAVV